MSIKSKFCAKCGAEVDSLIEGICPDCFSNSAELSLPSVFKLKLCKNCKAINYGKLWLKTSNPEKYFLSKLESKLKHSPELKIRQIKSLDLGTQGAIEVIYSVGHKAFSKIFNGNYAFEKALCKSCSQAKSQNPLATIQVRGQDKKVFDFLDSHTKGVASVQEHEKGIDILYTNNDDARKAARELTKALGTKMRETHKAYSWDRMKNKPKFKSTFLLRA